MRAHQSGVLVLAATALWSVPPSADLATRIASPQGAPSTTLATLLERGAGYIETYEHNLLAVVADETYLQTSGPLNDRLRVTKQRRLRSDLMLIDLGNSVWVEFRDTYEADGKPVREQQARLQTLFANPAADLLKQAQKLADESARYNLGVPRNINVPTMALTYLSRGNQARSTFDIDGQETIDALRTTILRFKETATPPLINVPEGAVETGGRFWLVPDTGEIRRTELSVKVTNRETKNQSKNLQGKVTVAYVEEPKLKMLVPSAMDEDFGKPTGVHDRGHATYSSFRTFAVDIATIRRGGGGD